MGSAEYASPTLWLLSNNWKTQLLLKLDFNYEARRVIAGSGIQISSDGFEYLGGAIGSHNFIRQIILNKISLCCEELNTLNFIAKSYPLAAYAMALNPNHHAENLKISMAVLKV